MGERTHCIAVKRDPCEIREAVIPKGDVAGWTAFKRREGWTVFTL